MILLVYDLSLQAFSFLIPCFSPAPWRTLGYAPLKEVTDIFKTKVILKWLQIKYLLPSITNMVMYLHHNVWDICHYPLRDGFCVFSPT